MAHPLPLSAGQLHFWTLQLDLPAPALPALWSLLSPDELDRAQRFKFDRFQRRYVAARGQLRKLLGSYLDLPARDLRFQYGQYGKPGLAGPTPQLQFNLAHSHELAVVAVTRDHAVGIDVEHRPRHIDLDAIARRFFAPGEVARWTTLPPTEMPEAFFRCWTRKEAYLKAHGAGLTVALDSFEVTFGAGEPARLLWTADGSVAGWALYDVTVPSDYTAAAALALGDGSPPTVFAAAYPPR